MRRSCHVTRVVRAWVSVVAALALALLAGDHILPSLHHVLVAHEICPEHGQLEHVDRARGRSDHGSAPALEPASADAAPHDHCGSVPASPPRAPIAVALAGGLAPAPGELTVPVCRSAAVFPADVVAFAPKQSPPA